MFVASSSFCGVGLISSGDGEIVTRGQISRNIGLEGLCLGHGAGQLMELDLSKPFLGHGLDPRVSTAHGKTKLHLALVGGNTNVTESLCHSCLTPLFECQLAYRIYNINHLCQPLF